jgi:D-amino-acid dehydrogenase
LAFLRWLMLFQRSCTRTAFDQGYAALARFAQPTFERFAELADAEVATTLTRPGLLHAFTSEHEARRAMRTQRTMAWTGYEIPDEPLTGAELTRLEPALGGSVTAGYLVPQEGVLDPSAFVESLAARLRKQDITIREHTTVHGFHRRAGRVTAVHTSEGDLECSSVIVAAGAWSADLLNHLGIRLPLQSGKGYSFSIDLDHPPVYPLYLGDKHVVVSPIGGATRIAGMMEFSGNNRELDWRRIVAIAHASRDYLGPWYDTADDLMSLIRDPWVGGRPMLPDGLPVLDRVPGTANAYVSTGHGMLGITLAPESGRAMADYVITGHRPDALEPFRTDRFSRLLRPASVVQSRGARPS